MSWALCAFLILRPQVAALADDSATSQHLMPRPSSSATKSMPVKLRRSVWMFLLTIADRRSRRGRASRKIQPSSCQCASAAGPFQRDRFLGGTRAECTFGSFLVSAVTVNSTSYLRFTKPGRRGTQLKTAALVPDPQSQAKKCQRRKSRTAPEHPKAESVVLRRHLDHRYSSLIAVLPGLLDAAEGPTRLAAGVLRVHTFSQVQFNSLQFLVQIVFETMQPQLSASATNCLRPARVRE